MSFVATFEEGDFTRIDPAPYKEVLSQLKVGVTATVVVPTGELNDKGRGLIEITHERQFRKAANDMGHGIKIGHSHMGDGNTRLRFTVGEKRTFSPEAAKKRDASLAKARLNKWVDRYMIEHPDHDRETGVKAYRTEQARRKAAQAAT